MLLLGCAYAKDKQLADYPATVTIKSNSIYEGTGIYINGVAVPTEKCSMIVYDDTTIYTVWSEGGHCKNFRTGVAVWARIYPGSIEFAWLDKGKVKTVRYYVQSRIAR